MDAGSSDRQFFMEGPEVTSGFVVPTNGGQPIKSTQAGRVWELGSNRVELSILALCKGQRTLLSRL